MVINSKEFDYSIISNLKELPKKKGCKHTNKYADVVCAFDIETTNIDSIRNAIMYIWQFQINDITVIGRTWKEFRKFIQGCKQHLPKGLMMVIYVHNLSFEFQFLKSVLKVSDIFAMDNRKVLKFNSDNLEFRCSYIHSNMNLEKFVEKCGSEYRKVKGFDYDKKRYPWTPLTSQELEYCINDVRALTSALINEMQKDKDDLYTIPLTSTGYVRRIFKEALYPLRKQLQKQLPTLDILNALRMAFRGGNTHANRWNANRLIEELVYSYDISSSYPSVLLTEKYPQEFIKTDVSKFEKALKYDKACLFQIALFDVELLNEEFGCPYLAKAKCENIIEAEYDNGRILSCKQCVTWITEVDFSILLKEYKFSYEILTLYTANKEYLPIEFRKLVLDMYKQKTLLKGGDPYKYNKYKNMINAVYGMTVTNPCKPNYIYKDGEIVIDEDGYNMANLVDDYLKNGWLPYQWGVYCTCYARAKLEAALHSVPYSAFLYADTDSIKVIGDYTKEIEALNKAYRHEEYSALDTKGKKHYIGIFEFEESYRKFKTMGAKKYAYVDMEGELHVTVSGVSKSKGAKELKDIRRFNEGFVFREAGGSESVYNDIPPSNEVIVDGKPIELVSNIALYPSTYTLGMTDDYRRLINYLSNIDIRYDLHYEY